MRDQAETLRQKILASQGALARAIAIVSGKGGVGKSNFSTNFAYALIAKGKKVIIVDMDIGMGNIHILLGQAPKTTLMDYLLGHKGIEEIINDTDEGLHFISGGSGLDQVVEWSAIMFDRLMSAFEYLQKDYDVILFDMGAGATKKSIELITAIDEVIVISTTEPTSITDAYSMMKYIVLKDPETTFYLVGNRVPKKQDGTEAVLRLQFAVKKFLQKETMILGCLPEDDAVQKAVIAQKPYILAYPNAVVSKKMFRMTEVFIKFNSSVQENKLPNFIQKLKTIFARGRW